MEVYGWDTLVTKQIETLKRKGFYTIFYPTLPPIGEV